MLLRFQNIAQVNLYKVFTYFSSFLFETKYFENNFKQNT